MYCMKSIQFSKAEFARKGKVLTNMYINDLKLFRQCGDVQRTIANFSEMSNLQNHSGS